jgi:preprotein translocase subunit SecY
MISLAQRRIPIRHVRKIGVAGSTDTVSYLPLKLNSAGVIPILFAASIQLLPSTIAMFLSGQSPVAGLMRRLAAWLTPGHGAASWLIYAGLVMFFTYFYTAVSFNTDQITDDLRTHGSFIPGIRPGKMTHDYLDTVLTRVTLAGALALAAVALLQYAVPMLTNAGLSVLGGTSLLIVVGVALDTYQSIEAQLAMRHYESFIR